MKPLKHLNCKSDVKHFLYLLLFILLTVGILTRSGISASYAALGLTLWYEKLLPSLLPFMILSGIMIRLGLTESFTKFLYPFLKPLLQISHNGCYALFVGFLCGFPMGAKTIADLLDNGLISREEGEYLISFCNNIGPVYFCSVVLPLLQPKHVTPYLLGMYGLAFLYGFGLRKIKYRKIKFERDFAAYQFPATTAGNGAGGINTSLLSAIDDSIRESMNSALALCGYMVLFNLCNLLPDFLLGQRCDWLAPMLEITGGIYLTGADNPLYVLLLMPFGGLSCIAQTYHCIRKQSLSLKSYLFHKLNLTILTAIYYLIWAFFEPSSFLR